MSWDGKERRSDNMDERLKRIEEKLILLTSSIDSSERFNGHILSDLKTILDRHDKTLYGNNGSKGMTIRIDRIEQHHENNKRHILIAWTAFIGMVVKTLWDVIIRR